MIEFVTLLLGLTMGIHDLEVTVGPDVAAVHWILDGQAVAETAGPPWRAQIDFGSRLVPRRLVALAVDEGGRPLGQSEQLLNYIRSSHEVSIVLYEDGEGRKIGGRALINAVMDEEPFSVSVMFDGEPLELDDYYMFRLPEYDPERPHALEAEALFSGEAVARAETTFGGGLGEELTSALSAVAVTSPLRRPWQPKAVEGRLRHGNRALPIFGTRSEGSRVVVIRDEALVEDLFRQRRFYEVQNVPEEKTLPLNLQVASVASRPLQDHGSTYEISDLGAVPPALGLVSVFLGRPELYAFDRSVGSTQPQDLWASVAVGGRMAAAENLPRAVVLLLGPEPKDAGTMSHELVAEYLETIQVPLLIWAPSGKVLKKMGLKGLPNAHTGPRGMWSVADAVASVVESQTMVWVEGTYLPNEIEVVEDAKIRPVSTSMLH